MFNYDEFAHFNKFWGEKGNWNTGNLIFHVPLSDARHIPGSTSALRPRWGLFAELIEELRYRREGKGRHWFFSYLMQVEGEGGVIVRQSLK